MFYYINGELALTEPGIAVVDAGGVGYKLFVSDNTLSALTSKLGQTVKLYTYLAVREDAMDLFGFKSIEEKNAFNMLITVSGVGPKAALSILSVFTPDTLAMAITTGDSKAISRANGVGSKTAARVVLELKDKISKELGSVAIDASDYGTPVKVTGDLGKYNDALNALVVLGYTRAESTNALKGLEYKAASLEDIITAALKNLMKKQF